MNPLLCCNFPPVSDCLLKRSKREIPGVVQFSSVQSSTQSCRTLQLHGLQHAWNLFKLMYIESVMPSNYLILCHPLLFLPSVFPNIKVFSNELAVLIRWPRYCNFSISPSNEYSGFISFRLDWFDLLKGLSRVFSSTTVQRHQFFSTQPSLWPNSHIHTRLLGKP